jgi:RNA 2',3'-cyclic 3'-phosphodiesterase
MSDRDRRSGPREGLPSLRLFVAILLPESWLTLLGDVQRDLRQAGLSLRYVRPEGIHLTLKFLGETPVERIAAVEGALAEAAASVRPFALDLGGLGTFGPPSRPRVVWAGIDGDRRRLNELFNAVERALHRTGIAPERQAFNPHLTLARVPDQMPTSEAVRIAPALERRAAKTAESHYVDSISLMRSELGPGGARYTALGSWRLGD